MTKPVGPITRDRVSASRDAGKTHAETARLYNVSPTDDRPDWGRMPSPSRKSRGLEGDAQGQEVIVVVST